ncbi:uncharacterized membrane-anchored protein YjiN (DUF445 family) [Salinibacter ruber]|uniref:DUF445 domain-containing protein n=3 Tax=Salinibacter ruber TaxID=146919 RepID=Q2RZM9_SALRD|nr:DUF445 family protein [Salinibacter ruber]ABC45354.1 hypothetical protein SRU_2504 [Salinibacter ruber DSM 13855]MBB4061855.1 uncharacterized membrane-anchored protein YjiN (DUF445 family) [Salinibacter ruber]MBB4068298.1 uncharacterized membrane-anchored protein YjiN (DUF445 family) [Salinibacter ruber]MCS3638580.1 uncharacterized membrane-anchored protein YjiN (DUF445 family) [Salinibacter ruber]MCS3662247.1 uncharacterized membrane-anchored protein YjiN (DUF445 family) [Salinibacter rube
MAAPDSDTNDGQEDTGLAAAVQSRSHDGATGRDASWPRLQRQIFRTASRHLPDSAGTAEAGVEPPPKRTGRYARWLPVLKALPWVLGALFALSFVWDFPGVTLTVAGYTVVLEDLLRFTAVSGLVGFGTNWLAITMLFRPREPRPLVGQGLVPAQRERVAYRLAQAVSDELINKALIKEKIRESGLVAQYRDLLVAAASDVATDDAVRTEGKALLRRALRDVLSTPSVQTRIVALTAEQVEAQAGEGLSGLMLRAYRYFGEDDFRARLRETVRRLPDAVDPLVEELDPVLDRLPAELERRSDEIESLLTRVVLRLVDTLDLERMIYENVRAYDERQLEMLLRRTTNEQLNYIKYLGAALGIIGGFIIWAPAAALVAVTTLGLAVYGLDEALFRARTDDTSSS